MHRLRLSNVMQCPKQLHILQSNVKERQRETLHQGVYTIRNSVTKHSLTQTRRLLELPLIFDEQCRDAMSPNHKFDDSIVYWIIRVGVATHLVRRRRRGHRWHLHITQSHQQYVEKLTHQLKSQQQSYCQYLLQIAISEDDATNHTASKIGKRINDRQESTQK